MERIEHSSLASTGDAARHRDTPKDELEFFAGDRSFVMSFARGMSVIRAFANVARPLSIAEVSHSVNIPRAAVRRRLHTLCELGYVKTVGSRYALAPKTLELGYAFSSSSEVARNLQPIINRLAERLHTFCALSIEEDDASMLLCMAGSAFAHGAARLSSPAAGSKAPLYASATGLLFLSTLSDAQREAYFARVSMRPITFRTPTMPAQLSELLARVRLQGYATCDRTFDNDLRCVAVPVHDQRGRLVAAVFAMVLPERIGDDGLQETLLPALREAAQCAGTRWR
jgi:IclR family pca regulon transcriptional regulator